MSLSSPAGLPPTPETTPDFRDVLKFFSGAFALMAGRKDGLQRFDLSADGFWTSFFAVVVALPPEALSWIEFESAERATPIVDTNPLLLYAIHALADVVAWLVPMAILIALSRKIGLSRKIVPLVVSANWGNALISWLCVPYFLIVMAAGHSEAMPVLSTFMQVAILALTVRVMMTATGLDLVFSLGIVFSMWTVSLVVYAIMIDATGLVLI